MSANELRQAATILRERANAAEQGPWGFETYGNGFAPLVHSHRSLAVAETMDKPHLSDARYIATVHPGVGLALADWLDDAATWMATPGTVNYDGSAITIARLINGGAA